jgi:hypothetical protein
MTLIVDKIGAEFKLDGYDNGGDYGKYQMVPLDGTRTLTIKTNQLPVRVEVSKRNSRAILIGRFRKKDGSPIPGIEPLRMANDIVFKVPANTEAQFDVQGQAFANAFISVEEIGDDITFSDSIIIGVKPKIIKKMAFVFFSDLRGDVKRLFTDKAIDPRAVMAKANTSFLSQLNLELQELEPGKPIDEVKSGRDFGNPIKVDTNMDPEKVKASFLMASEVAANFPRLFPSTHFVILLTRPVTSKSQSKVIDINIKFSGNTNVIFLTPSTSNADETMKAFMHEVGHACGAQHVTARPSIMFPNLGPSLTMRFLGEHIESVHNVGPVFPLAI